MNLNIKKSLWLLSIIISSQTLFAQNALQIEQSILNDSKSFYYIDFAKYSKPLNELPIGVFDSGTGGLTVLDALINFDQYNNATLSSISDGIKDFEKEKFIYLADQANMPYGNYNATHKDNLLKEHIIKDFQFLLANKYYNSPKSANPAEDKQQVKAIVIACNTATAYGYQEAQKFLSKTGLKIPVIGVINAAARGTLAQFDKNETGAIAVFATVGTIASKGYERTLKEMIQVGDYNESIQIYNQGGYGLAEAVDEEPDFISKKALEIRSNYRGPSLNNTTYKIDRTLLDVYNFNFDHNKMLCDSKNIEDCSDLQLNDSENYVRYHLVSLLEQMRKSSSAKPLKALILGCTHYPYLIKEINQIMDELRQYRNLKGELVYNHLIGDHVHIIDPSIYVAQELFEALKENQLFNQKADMYTQSEFYISVPNVLNENVKLDADGRFTYDYKYGRDEGTAEEFVKVVPFDRQNVSEETLLRFQNLIPNTYKVIQNFSKENPKMKGIRQADKI